jgi:hypothetical protein
MTHKSMWLSGAKVLGWSAAGAFVAAASCLVGFLYSRQTGNATPWWSLLAAMGLTTAPGRFAFAAGIAVGVSFRSFYRNLVRLGFLGLVIGAVAFMACAPIIDSGDVRTSVMCYALVGGTAGLVVAIAQLVRDCRRTATFAGQTRSV